MTPKNNPRNWNDVQTAIATAAIVTTLGLWNLFATPAKAEVAQADPPASPPPTDPPSAAVTPTLMPQVSITFATQPPPQPAVTQKQQNRKKKNDGGGGGGKGGSTTKTKSS